MLKHLLNLSVVLQRIFEVNQDIIHIGSAEVVQVIKQDIIDISLKRSRSVAKTERQDLIFVELIPCLKGGQILNRLLHLYSVEHLSHIQLNKYLCFRQSHQHLLNQR